MEHKAPHRTRERILDRALRLFNEFGEPNVTTTAIAEELKISPGNLYYHFRNKDDIVNSLFTAFDEELQSMTSARADRRLDIEDIWLYVRLTFELVWRYRFFFRDLNDLLSRNRRLETYFKQILAHTIQVATQLCMGLRRDDALEATDLEIDAIATNMAVICVYWLSFEYVQNPRKYSEKHAVSEALARGTYQVLSLTAPYLRGDARLGFKKLASERFGAIS
ncbi:MAG: TetR/AcrR family transcriptional regulator [Noviherbaspirillum sp.]|nr:TetR/AcrR family transcriptional regulator [Noviherbaspirillum sp.]